MSKTLRCTACGGTLELRAEGATRTIVCVYCGAALDATSPELKILARYDAAVQPPPLIQIGARGVLRGEQLQVVGWMRRAVRCSGVDYEWDEYLLWNPYRGYRWLLESNGHWSLLRTVEDLPQGGA